MCPSFSHLSLVTFLLSLVSYSFTVLYCTLSLYCTVPKLQLISGCHSHLFTFMAIVIHVGRHVTTSTGVVVVVGVLPPCTWNLHVRRSSGLRLSRSPPPFYSCCGGPRPRHATEQIRIKVLSQVHRDMLNWDVS